MKYRLNDNNLQNKKDDIEEIFFKNRNINNYQQYKSLGAEHISDWQDLDMINEAKRILMRHLEQGSKIAILVDEDADGFTSGAMMFSYLENLCNSYGFNCDLDYVLHKKAKEHGLSNDVDIDKSIDLLIIPDAGMNDIEECNRLLANGVDIIILDHHVREDYVNSAKTDDEKIGKEKTLSVYDTYMKNGHIAVVNNQTSVRYHNKSLCGAGVVYQFLRCLDEEFPWNNVDADHYLDLCALANISDAMDMHSEETKAIVNLGLRNITNKCFRSLCDAQEYSMNGNANMHNVQWYVTPIINGCIRFGSLKEKELLFRAFIEKDETFQYKKRATKNKPAEVIDESIYTRAARLCKNAKSRQDRARNKAVPDIVKLANSTCANDKVAIVDVTNSLDSSLTGLVAIQVAEKIRKPCLLVRRIVDKDTNITYLHGSARNISNCPISNLQQVLESTKQFEYVQGHPNAFGVGIAESHLDSATDDLNCILADTEYDNSYIVDFIFDENELDVLSLRELCQFDDYAGNQIPEITFAVEHITLSKGDINICGSKLDTLQFNINEIRCVMFRCNEENELYDFVMNDWDHDAVTFNAVCKVQVSFFNGVKQYGIVIKDVDIITKVVIDDELGEEGW